MGLLTGIRIVDLTRGTAGPLLTQLLADMGPEMVRVDVPGTVRRQPGDLVRLRGRRSICLDLDQPEAIALLRRLMGRADVFVSEPDIYGRNPVPWAYAEMAKANPRLVYCRLSGSGDEGPEASAWAHDHLIAAAHGVYDQPGWREGPTFGPAGIPSLGAALLGLQAIGAALYVRERTGLGQEVTTSLLAGSLAFQPAMVKSERERPLLDTGLVSRRALGTAPFYSIYECADGRWLHFGCLTHDFQVRAMSAIGREAELKALGFLGPGWPNADARDRIVDLITERMKQQTFAEWAATFEAADIPYAPSQWPEDLLDDPQVLEQGMVLPVDDPTAGSMQQMGRAVVFEDETVEPLLPAPLPGAHGDEVCRELGLSGAEIRALRASGALQ